MNLFEILKQFKNIESNPAYKETSRRAILAFEPKEPAGWSARRTILRIIETGAAVALTGFFVLLITGALSGTGLTPRYSAVDAQSLRAEAQAIDIQIQLANVNYNTPSAESTAPVAGAKKSGGTAGIVPLAGTGTTSATSSTSTVSIDQALQSLTK